MGFRFEKRGIRAAAVYGPFNKAKERLEKEGYRLGSLDELVEEKLLQGPDSLISKQDYWVRDQVLYIPAVGGILFRSPKRLICSIKPNKRGKIFGEIYPSEIEIASALSMTNCCMMLPETITQIKNDQFGSNPFLVFTLGNGNSERAQSYGDFLKSISIGGIMIYKCEREFINLHDKPFVRQVWFKGFDKGSGIIANYHPFNHWVFGMKSKY